MRFVMFGSGAIGGTAAAYMAKNGEDVLLVDQVKEHVDAMNEKGLRLSGIRGDLTVPVRAASPHQLSGPLETVLLATKSQHTMVALDVIEPHLGPNSCVVSMQNGVNEPEIAARIGAGRTIGCFVNFSADYQGPGHIEHGRAGSLYIGELDGRETPRILRIQQALSHLTTTHVTDNIMGCVWTKHCKASLDLATALDNATTFETLSDRSRHPALVPIVQEAVAVAEAEGIRLEAFDAFDPSKFNPGSPDWPTVASDVLVAMAAGKRDSIKVRTGYWRDMAVRKRKTEVDHVTGDIVARARKHGLPVPASEALVRMIKEIEDGARPMQPSNFDELARAASSRTIISA
ncbi:MAG: 2-dehydropantoate 2-reductase [Chloroflexi bacterium]|nr:2-dehydropantoate 2-reductase [Chloroflexota bacterium]